MSLITLAKAQEHPSFGRLDDTLGQSLLDRATAMIETYCNRTFAKASYTEKHNGDDTIHIFTKQLPLESLASGIDILEADEDTVNSPVTDFRWDTVTGEIRYKDPSEVTGDYDYFPSGFQNITIKYTAGYQAIPEPVQEACVEIALVLASQGSNSNDLALGANTAGDYSYDTRSTAVFQGCFNKTIKDMLFPYRVINPGF